MPAFDGGDDFVWVCGPCEGLWRLVCLGEEAVDGSLEIDDGSENAAFQTSLEQLGEVALDGVEPGAGGRREVEDEALMPCEPGTNLGMLMHSKTGSRATGFGRWSGHLENENPIGFHRRGSYRTRPHIGGAC